MTIRRMGTVLAGLSMLLLAASCGGGGDDGGGDITLDPARAAELAHAALLVPGDLPGSGWEVSGEDSFSDDDEPPFDTAACREITDTINAATRASEEQRAGRAQRAISRMDSGAILETEVDLSVNVFGDVDSPRETMDTYRGVLTSDEFEECFIDGLKESVEDDGVSVDAETVKPSATAPFDGQSVAFAFHIEAGGEQVDMAMEFYVWRWGNVGVSLGLSGPGLDADFVKEVVGRSDERIRATAGAE